MGKSASEYVVKMREQAHAIWEREGRPEGQAERHWAQAEEELRGDAAPAAPEAASEPEASAPPDTHTTGGMLP